MKTDRHAVEVLVRVFFHEYFTRAAGMLTCDISSAQPITIKQIMVNNIDEISKDFNARIARAFAKINDIEIPQKLSSPKTFEGATALIKYSLGGEKDLYDYMVERYKYHFTLALSGIVENADNITDTSLHNAARLMK